MAKITDDQKEYIRQNNSRKKEVEIQRRLGISRSIQRFKRQEGVTTYWHNAIKAAARRHETRERLFNVNARDNWVV